MEEVDNVETSKGFSDEELFLSEVIRGEADLLYLDSYLKEIFERRK